VKKSSPTPSPPASTRTSRSKNFSNPGSFPQIFLKASAATNFAAQSGKVNLALDAIPISDASPGRVRIFARHLHFSEHGIHGARLR